MPSRSAFYLHARFLHRYLAGLDVAPVGAFRPDSGLLLNEDELSERLKERKCLSTVLIFSLFEEVVNLRLISIYNKLFLEIDQTIPDLIDQESDASKFFYEVDIRVAIT